MGNKIANYLLGARTMNLVSLSLLREPAKFVDFLKRTNILFSSLASAHGPMRLATFSELLCNTPLTEILIPFPYVTQGSTPLGDLAVLAALAKERHPRRVFEVGTFEGLSAVTFALNVNPSAAVYTLDLPPSIDNIQRTNRSWQAHQMKFEYESGRLVDVLDCGNKVTRLIGDSALFDFAPYHDQIDLFYIDGMHTEDYVCVDSLHAFKCISSNGCVVWHDCFVSQVQSVLNKIAKYQPVSLIRGTNLAVSFGKPTSDFPWSILNRSIR